MLPLAKIYQIRQGEPDPFLLSVVGALRGPPPCDTALSRTSLPSPMPFRMLQGCASQTSDSELHWAAGMEMRGGKGGGHMKP